MSNCNKFSRRSLYLGAAGATALGGTYYYFNNRKQINKPIEYQAKTKELEYPKGVKYDTPVGKLQSTSEQIMVTQP
jgi:hypothetical protein